MGVKMIESITDPEIEKVVANISAAATNCLRQYAADKQEEALLLDLRCSGKSKKELVLSYLQRTARKVIRNQYVADRLWIDTATLKQIREQLEREGKIEVYMDGGVIHLRVR